MSDWSIAMLHRYNLNALQAKCMDLAADGRSRKEIALMLGIDSAEKVTERLTRVARKMGLDPIRGQCGLAFARARAIWRTEQLTRGKK